MCQFPKRAKFLTIKAKKEVFSDYFGSHISKRKGESFDFAELKEYEIGDDVRHIDWKITAKKQKPYVKRFHEESRLFINVVSLLGGSTHFGSRRLKQDLIAEINAILFFSALKIKDLFCSFIFANREFYKSKITNSIGAVQKEVEKVLSFSSIGEHVDFNELNTYFIKKIKRRSILFLVGDFLEGIANNELPNLTVISKKHEVVAIVVRDRLEEDLGDFTNASFLDPSLLKHFSGFLNKRVKIEYQQRIVDYDKLLFTYFKKNQIRYIKIYTDEKPFKKLARFLDA